MGGLRLLAIMKTDIGSSTPRLRSLAEPDLKALLAQHREFVVRHAAAHGGYVVKPEGDGFWLVFPSVTAACLAAMTMQEDLRLEQAGRGDDRLAIRIVVSVGDVLQEEGALIGDPVVLAARIESITPLDEIYLSAAAWLAVSRGEVRTSAVDTFSLKGFPDPVAVYRIDQIHRTRVIENQYIVVTDLRGFTVFTETHSMTDVEKVLDHLLALVGRVCREFGGTHRFGAGDSHCLTFSDAGRAMAAVEDLTEAWERFQRGEGFGCPIKAVVHKGVLYAYRSYLYGDFLNVALRLEGATRELLPDGGHVLVTGPVRRELTGTAWEGRLGPVAVPRRDGRLEGLEVYRLLREGGTP
jgi:class 3 adenylate cyclase